MGHKQVVLTAALLLLAIFLLTGCPGSNPAAPINNTGRDYGPPLNQIIFDDGAGYLATVPSEALTENPTYVHGFGLNGISKLAYGFLIDPTATPGDANFAAFDLETEMLHVVDSEGSVTSTYFDGDEAVENMFAFSNGGARLAYVRVVNNEQQLRVVGVTVSDLYEIVTLSSSRQFFGRPTADISFDIANIAMMTVDANQQTRIEIYDLGGTIDYQLTTPVKALTYSNGGDYLAWFDESGEPSLVIRNSSLSNEICRRQFDYFGVGASALSWSPDDNMIAFFAEAVDFTGRLVIYDLISEDMDEIIFDGTYIFPEENDKLWALPSWNETSTELTFVVLDEGQNEELSFNVVKVDLTGFTTVLYEGVGKTRYVEWMK